MKNAVASHASEPPQLETLNAVDVVLGPTLRDEMQVIDRFVLRLRAWEPRMALAFTALPDRPDGGLRILNSGPPWSREDVDLLEKRVMGLAREFRIEASTHRLAIPDAAERPVWDVSWVDEQLRTIDEDSARARARIEQRLAELERSRIETCARISAEMSLYRYCWMDEGREDYIVAIPDSPAVRDLEYARREVPDFYGDATASHALARSIVGSGLSLTATASTEGEMSVLIWKCTIGDWRPRCSGFGGTFSGEGLDMAAALCAACIAYLDAL